MCRSSDTDWVALQKRKKGVRILAAIIVCTHGKFSDELVKSSEMIFGKQENVAAVIFQTGEGADALVQKYEEAISTLDCDGGVLFMVDLFGGSPFNAASRIAIQNDKMDIVTGVNLPMLLEVYGAKSFSSVSELAQMARESGREGIKLFRENLNQISEEEL